MTISSSDWLATKSTMQEYFVYFYLFTNGLLLTYISIKTLWDDIKFEQSIKAQMSQQQIAEFTGNPNTMTIQSTQQTGCYVCLCGFIFFLSYNLNAKKRTKKQKNKKNTQITQITQ